MVVLCPLAVCAAAFAQTPTGTPDAIIPVVGSLRGAFSSNFKTQLQLNNRSDEPMSGVLVFRADSARGGAAPQLAYSLAPHETLSFADILPAMNTSGLGSLDVFAEEGDIPTIVARAYDHKDSGSAGVAVPALGLDDVLEAGDESVLVVSSNREHFRTNIGIRTLDEGANVIVFVRDSAGQERHRLGSIEYPANFFEQRNGEWFTRTALQPDDVIVFQVLEGRMIVYSTNVDNRTNDSTIQIGRALSRVTQ